MKAELYVTMMKNDLDENKDDMEQDLYIVGEMPTCEEIENLEG